MSTVRFKTEESIALVVELTDGDWTAVTAVESVIRREPSTTPLLPMTITAVPPAGADPARWKLTLPAGLPEPGKYVVDVRFTVSGSSYVTDTVGLIIERAVTPR